MFRPVHLIVALLSALAVAGCAAPGVEPTVSERRTVEVPELRADKPGEMLDPAFAPERLRGIDVCETLRAAGLEKYGTPAPEFSPDGFGTCSNYMKDHNGKDFGATLYFDYAVQEPSKHQIAGLPAEMSENGTGTCFVSAAYAGADLKMFETARGVGIQLSSEQGDACSPAVQLLTDVIDVVRNKPQVNARTSGGLAGFDPCEITDPEVLRRAMAGANPDSSGGRGLYECKWFGENGVVAVVSFQLGSMQETSVPPGAPPPPPLDLGAPTAVEVYLDPPSCAIEWEHRKAAADSEFVHVEISNSESVPLDPCTSAGDLARQVRSKLPRA
ncbi:hypothetical protein [Saccharopolyspora sp. NPDC002686]|uniref:hypothetical protein n=1 Tax=Saccharopolyspora sp. NPDC002686 TaxID=3154541 RepID=UPI00332E63D5